MVRMIPPVGDSNGLVIIRDFRNRAAIPRDSIPNENQPVGSVGPNVPAGFGDTHAMYPAGMLDQSGLMPEVEAWQGWPTGWHTPNWNGGTIFHRLVSTLWTCIDLNTRQLASFPPYGVIGASVFRLPTWADNPEPEMYSDWTEAAKQMFNTFQANGEIVLWCTGRFANGRVARFVVLNPALVNVEWADGRIEYSLSGKPLEREDVCHIKYESWPTNLRGISPLEWAARSIISAEAIERMSTDMASRGGVPWGVIKTPRKLNKAEATDLQNSWVQGARHRQGAPAILSGTLELEMLESNPKDMALLDMRVFDEQRIAAALGVPPFLVGLPQPEGLTYANANALFDFHWRATLRTMASSVARAMSAWILPRGQTMEFNREEYVKPGPKERAEIDAILFNIKDEHGNRARTVEEIRAAERFIPSEPDDVEAIASVFT
jgi:HK97 family phage portal protein